MIDDKTSALLAAQAGVWDYDMERDRFCYCRGAALAFGLPNDQRLTGLGLGELAAVVHPEDRATYLAKVAPILRSGGMINATLRTDPALGPSRRLLMRGNVSPAEGRSDVRTSGIVVDLSDSGLLEAAQDEVSDGRGAFPAGLLEGIDHLIAARRCLAEMRAPDAKDSLLLLDHLLINLARGLAQEVRARH
ncbi:PAS domain-containing protein [Methylobacterium sp. J-068]|uniref:PAS domain-containing protein n=1 Tax=Methylobacterium sp. J-068 TaxID=2836649 RepID=UPI001FBADFF4|nr:PAS domain-containing protein [Methylobacterium sp. J-068]MCJ2035418.1 PAS domain-containing protein [Methylobacterium sp. J-068]